MEWEELTRREQQVMALAAYGWSNRQIAVLLGISQRTVEQYRGRAQRTLRIEARTNLRDILAAVWPQVAQLAIPEMLRFHEIAIAELKAELAWAERASAADRPK